MTMSGSLRDSDGERKVMPTRKEVIYRLAKLGCSKTEIATVLGVDESRLCVSPYTEIYEKGLANVKRRLRRAQIETALNGCYTMQIWLGKQLLKQHEPPHEISGEDGKPIELTMSVVSKAAKVMTDKIKKGTRTEDT